MFHSNRLDFETAFRFRESRPVHTSVNCGGSVPAPRAAPISSVPPTGPTTAAAPTPIAAAIVTPPRTAPVAAPATAPNIVEEFVCCIRRQSLSYRERRCSGPTRHDGRRNGYDGGTGQHFLNQLTTIHVGHGSSLQSCLCARGRYCNAASGNTASGEACGGHGMIADTCETALTPANARIAQTQAGVRPRLNAEAATTQIISTASGIFPDSRNVQATGECSSPHRTISRS